MVECYVYQCCYELQFYKGDNEHSLNVDQILNISDCCMPYRESSLYSKRDSPPQTLHCHSCPQNAELFMFFPDGIVMQCTVFLCSVKHVEKCFIYKKILLLPSTIGFKSPVREVSDVVTLSAEYVLVRLICTDTKDRQSS